MRRTGQRGAREALQLAFHHLRHGEQRDAWHHSRVASRLARQPGSRAAAAVALAVCALVGGSSRTALNRIGRAGCLVDALDESDLRDEAGALGVLACAEYVVGRPVEALQHADLGLRLAGRDGRLEALPEILAVRAAVVAALGRLDEARHDAVAADHLAKVHDHMEGMALAGAMSLPAQLWRSGPARFDDLLEGLPVAAGLYRAIARLCAAQAQLTVGQVEPGRTLPAFARIGADRADGPWDVAVIAARVLAEPSAADATAQLVRARQLARGSPSQLGYVELAAAAVAVDAGAAAEAAQHAMTAVTMFTQVGHPVFAALARMRLAETHAARGDRARARTELSLAKQDLSGCGAAWLTGHAIGAERRLGASLPRPGGHALSTREREVAELVAEGLTNQQIARRLVLSPRTVEGHVARLMAKLDVPNRAAVARQLNTG